MKTTRARLVVAVMTTHATASVAMAHPGHDGEHGLTWDFSHLGQHPLATSLCGLVVAASVWGFARLVVASVERRQSLRRSAASRGK